MNAPARPSPLDRTLRWTALALGGLAIAAAAPAFSQAGARGAESSGMVSRAGELTVLTVDGGTGDILIALDSRAEQLMAYRATPREGVQLLQRLDVAQAFSDARARALGAP